MKFFVKFDCTIHPDNYQAQCESVSGVTFHSALKCIPGVVIVSADSLMVAPELQKLAGVVYVEADSTVEAALTPDDTYPSDAGLVQINAHAAWDLETGDGSIIVGVIDSGLKLDHEDIVANLWIDPNASYPKSGYDFYNADTDPTDVYGHGTAMSGIIAAVGNNAKGLAGVCWAAKIMALKCSESGTFNLTAVVSAIDFAIDHGARVLNMSYTSAVYSETEAAAMQAAYEAGLLCVCSAGNTGTNNDTAPKYPASYTLPNIISVMGTNRFKGIASAGNGGFNSCYGKTSVDIAAPSFVDKALLLNGSYGALASGGTSQSAAYVSGVCALVLSARPDLHALDVKRIIMESAFPMSVITTGDLLHPSDLSMTGGIVDAFAAVKMALVYESRTAPLSEKVKGRLVNLKSVRREDGKFDVETEVTWPEASFLKDAETVLAAPDANTTVEAGTGTAKILRFGTVGREIKDEFGVETDKLPVFDYEDSDLTDGLYKTTTRLMGIQSQIPELTPSKKWNWRLNTEKITVPSAAWFVHAIGREWKKLVTPKTLSWQQIRRMIGGDFTVEVNPEGVPVAIPFNKYISWISGRSYPKGYCVYVTTITDGKLYTANKDTSGTTRPDASADWDEGGGSPTAWVEYGDSLRYGSWKSYWRKSYNGIIPGPHYANSFAGGYYDQEGSMPTGAANSVFTLNGDSTSGVVKYYHADSRFYKTIYNNTVALATTVAKTIGTVWRVPELTYDGLTASYNGIPQKDDDRHYNGSDKIYQFTGKVSIGATGYIPSRVGLVVLVATSGTYVGYKAKVQMSTTQLWNAQRADFTAIWDNLTPAEFVYTDTDMWRVDPHNIGYRTVHTAFTPANISPTYEPRWNTHCHTGLYEISPSHATYGAGQTKHVWAEFDEKYLSGVIGIDGLGTYPQNTVVKVGVINSDGGAALSASSRVSFYTNPHENPEFLEAGSRLRRHEDVMVLRTYFAIDPMWVQNKRIPADVSEFGNELFHPEDPNVSVEYKTIPVGDIFAIEAIITRIGEYEADEVTLSSDPNEGATVSGTAVQMNGASRNYPQVDPSGYWGAYHRVPQTNSITGSDTTSGKPAGAYKDVG